MLRFQELDLSKNAYIGFTESSKETEWLTHLQSAIDRTGSYVRVKVIRLVAMMLVVYVKQEHFHFVSSIGYNQVPTGIMSVLVSIGCCHIGPTNIDTVIWSFYDYYQ